MGCRRCLRRMRSPSLVSRFATDHCTQSWNAQEDILGSSRPDIWQITLLPVWSAFAWRGVRINILCLGLCRWASHRQDWKRLFFLLIPNYTEPGMRDTLFAIEKTASHDMDCCYLYQSGRFGEKGGSGHWWQKSTPWPTELLCGLENTLTIVTTLLTWYNDCRRCPLHEWRNIRYHSILHRFSNRRRFLEVSSGLHPATLVFSTLDYTRDSPRKSMDDTTMWEY